MSRRNDMKMKILGMLPVWLLLTTSSKCEAFTTHKLGPPSRAGAAVRLILSLKYQVGDGKGSSSDEGQEKPQFFKQDPNEESRDVPFRKFIGQQQPPPTELYRSGQRVSLFDDSSSDDNNNKNLQRERQREFNLVGNFERTLPLQTLIVAASLVFVLYVGFSGGITDGSERDFGGYDLMDDGGGVQQIYFDSRSFDAHQQQQNDRGGTDVRL